MTVDAFIVRVAQQLRAVSDGEAAGNPWKHLSPAMREYWVTLAQQHLMALSAMGLPAETLAALASGTWKAVPVEPTAEMFDAWLKQGGVGNLAAQWAAMLLAVAKMTCPHKPQAEQAEAHPIRGQQCDLWWPESDAGTLDALQDESMKAALTDEPVEAHVTASVPPRLLYAGRLETIYQGGKPVYIAAAPAKPGDEG